MLPKPLYSALAGPGLWELAFAWCGRALALFCAGEADVRAEWAGWLAGWLCWSLVGWVCLSYRGLFLFCVWVDEIVFLLRLLVVLLCLVSSGPYTRHIYPCAFTLDHFFDELAW